jgi:carboxypeptidase Taq
MEAKLNELKQRLMEISDLESAANVLVWDQSTYMPPKGAPYRARQMATLQRIAHEKSVEPELGRLLDDLVPYGETLPYDSDAASLIRVVRREFDRRTRVPASFIAELFEHFGNGYQIWAEARPENDFGRVVDVLEQTLDMSRRYASYFPYDHIADPLIDENDYGMKAEDVRHVFAELREALVPLVHAIGEQPPVDASCLFQPYPEDQQLDFGIGLAQDFGYDIARGRQDLTHHPFEIKLSHGDVRITTRVKPDDLTEALFGTLHEAGHALYEQGVSAELDGTPLNTGTSAAVHESQSRMWENVVGRSLPFWERYYQKLQYTFSDQLGDVSLETFYRAINRVQRSLVRTDADEVTYNLHIMIRFDLELALLEGTLAVRDLPEAWNARYESDLGVRPASDHDGVLQDVHWYAGFIGGGFQGYALGNIMSLQFYDAAVRANPAIPSEIAHGQFATLHGWLRDNIYCHGSKLTANELLERTTGGPLSIAPYIAYLHRKFGELYNLS